MSEAATLALPVPREIASNAETHSHVPPTARSFSFTGQRWKSGVTQAASGAGLLVMGVFLLSQIESTPALVAQLAILGSVCSIGGLVLLAKAARDCFGRLVINDAGIAVRPGFTGYSIAWNELARWEVQLDSKHAEAHSVRFWTADSPCAMFIPNSWLSDEDRAYVRHSLMSYAAGKSQSANFPRGQ